LEARGSLFYPEAERRITVAHHDRATQWFEL
jgi:hypothetical protein